MAPEVAPIWNLSWSPLSMKYVIIPAPVVVESTSTADTDVTGTTMTKQATLSENEDEKQICCEFWW